VQHRVSARDGQRIQAAVDRGAIPPGRVAFYEAKAARGEDISFVDVLWSPGPPAAAGRTGTVAAAAAAQADGGPEYGALFGSVEEGQRRADEVRAGRRNEVAAMTDDELYASLFPPAARAAAAPVAASAAGPASQHGRGEARTQRYRVHAPYVSLRVPQGPTGPVASAESAKTSWRVIDLHGGDLVPVDAHPDDIARLLHQRNRLGTLIKRVT
jgi:hypothetical protein